MTGKDLVATPNGRRAGTLISHGPNPDPGFMPGGTRQMEIDESLLGDEHGIEIVEAYADPTKYPDLVAGVTGFSTFSNILPPNSRKWIVDRLLQQDTVKA